jgi:hypothetical protein
MSRWTPCKRRDFIRRLRDLGFDGPLAGRLPKEGMQLPGSKGGYILNWTPEVQMEIPIKNGSNWCGWVYNRN